MRYNLQCDIVLRVLPQIILRRVSRCVPRRAYLRVTGFQTWRVTFTTRHHFLNILAYFARNHTSRVIMRTGLSYRANLRTPRFPRIMLRRISRYIKQVGIHRAPRRLMRYPPLSSYVASRLARPPAAPRPSGRRQVWAYVIEPRPGRRKLLRRPCAWCVRGGAPFNGPGHRAAAATSRGGVPRSGAARPLPAL